MIALVLAIARGWLRIYTRGTPAAVRDARRAEIECDLWEQRHEQQSRDQRVTATALDVLGRVVRGVPSDLSWRVQHRERRGVARRLRGGVVAARRYGWTVFPALVDVIYVTGAARIGTPSFVDTPEQLAMAVGAAAILWGMLLLWRGTAPAAGAWLVCLGAAAPVLLIARGAPLSLLWAVLAMGSATRRSDALRAQRRRVAC
jgi:hypothetical protein